MPIDAVAPPLRGPVLSRQHWDNLSFLHWPVAPATVAHLFPPGVRPDVVDRVTYVGLVPFQMRGAGPARVPVPYLGRFCETNVRLYSVDDQDRHGVVFLTLEAARLATVLMARAGLGVPYSWARMSARRAADTVTYRSVRRWPDRARRAGGTVRLQIGVPTAATPLEVWLTSRWGLHTQVAGRSIWIPNEHEPWTFRAAELLSLDCDLVQACGVSGAEDERMLRPLWSPGVHASFGPPSRVTQ